MKVNTLVVLVIGVLINGCSQVTIRGQGNLGVKQLFISQAGLCNNKVLISSGKIDSSHGSDGWGMIDARTDKLVRISGDAVIVDATSEQISTYTGAKSLKEAQEKLNALIQEDGTVLKQPISCTSSK